MGALAIARPTMTTAQWITLQGSMVRCASPYLPTCGLATNRIAWRDWQRSSWRLCAHHSTFSTLVSARALVALATAATAGTAATRTATALASIVSRSPGAVETRTLSHLLCTTAVSRTLHSGASLTCQGRELRVRSVCVIMGLLVSSGPMRLRALPAPHRSLGTLCGLMVSTLIRARVCESSTRTPARRPRCPPPTTRLAHVTSKHVGGRSFLQDGPWLPIACPSAGSGSAGERGVRAHTRGRACGFVRPRRPPMETKRKSRANVNTKSKALQFANDEMRSVGSLLAATPDGTGRLGLLYVRITLRGNACRGPAAARGGS